MNKYLLGILAMIEHQPEMWESTALNCWHDGWKHKEEAISIHYRYVPKGNGTGIKYVPEETALITYDSWMKHLPVFTAAERVMIYNAAERFLTQPMREKQRLESEKAESKDRTDAEAFQKRVEAFAPVD